MKGADRSQTITPWVCLSIAALLPFFGSFAYFVLAGDHPIARWIYGGVKLFTILWPLIALRWLIKSPIRFRFPSSISVPRSLLEGLCLGGILGGSIWLTMLTPLGDLVATSSGSIGAKIDDLGLRNHFWTFAVVISVGHSLLEEYYWRGFVFGQLRLRFSLFWSHSLAGLTFSLHHMVICSQFFPMPWGILLGGSVAIGGVCWSLLYQRHGHFYGAWLSHLIVDLGLMTIGARLVFG
ncbi:CPBP family intramembrane metalloprotease [bacterium]|nr:CPBP family intramembrane metalloprotease [Verrucomicrobiota bacterium]MDA7500214.1 CPBP family intramembrane metalloprotease [bacterium]MDA7645126.1 CPBP family intramembrane metalloprotease [bacterium]